MRHPAFRAGGISRVKKIPLRQQIKYYFTTQFELALIDFSDGGNIYSAGGARAKNINSRIVNVMANKNLSGKMCSN